MNHVIANSGRFSIPRYLLGRRLELDKLQDEIKRAQEGKAKFVSISGNAGAGKTALVDEFISEAKNEYPKLIYAKGKFEQLETNKPYSALLQILEQLSKYVLLLEEQEFLEFKQEIKKVLSNNLAVLTSLAPSFTPVLGEQPTPVVVGAAETKNRFNLVIESLLSVFARHGEPLILFFDDLQWADSLSIELLERLHDYEWSCDVLLLGSYRCDEFEKNKPLLDMVSRLSEKNNITGIQLENLPPHEVSSFVAKALGDIPEKVHDVATHIMNFTKGNAFGVNHYLTMLYRDGHIKYDDECNAWVCDVNSDHRLSTKSSVDELIKEMIGRLSKRQQLILHYGVCLQEYFSLESLIMHLGGDAAEIMNDIKVINNQGLVDVIDEVTFQFKHDRILRAAIETLDSDKHNALKLGIARELVAKLSPDEIDERSLEIVDYFNSSFELLTNDELKKVLDLNIKATNVTLQSGIFDLALHYSLQSLASLQRLGEVDHALEYSIYLNLARSYYLNADYVHAKKIIDDIEKIAVSIDEKCRCFGVYKDIVISEGGGYASIVERGCEVLKGFGIEIPVNGQTLNEEVYKLRKHVNNFVAAKTVSEHIDSPEPTNDKNKYLLVLLNDLWEASYYAGNEQVMQYLNLLSADLSLRNGNTSESAFGYVMVGMLETLDGNYEKAYGLGELALKLNDKFQDKVMLPKVTNLFCNYISFYRKPFSHSASLYKTSAEVGQGNGDHLFGLWAAMFNVWCEFLSGKPLNCVSEIASKYRGFVKQTGDTKIIYVFSVLEDIIQYLAEGENDKPPGEYGDYIEFWQQNNFLPGISWLHILLGQLYCIKGDFDKANSLFSKQGLNISPGIIMFPYSQYVFYSTLSRIKVLQKNNMEEPVTNDIEGHIQLLSRWRQTSPENFEYQYYLLEAERSVLNEKCWNAQKYFNKALTSAENYGNNFSIAFCNELKANFLDEAGDKVVGSFHRNIASNYYLAWGAKNKALDISLNAGSNSNRQFEPASDADVGYDPRYQATHSRDFDSILKLTKALSKQLDEDALLSMALEILVENTQPERAALLLNDIQGTELRVYSDKKSDFLSQHLNAKLEKTALIPASLIRYVVRSKNALVLDNRELNDSDNESGHVIEQGVQSVICLPVLHHNNVQIILYMESRLAPSYFDSDRIRILSIVLSQVRMELNNIKLYSTLQEESTKLKQTAEMLELSEQRLSLATMYSEVGVWEWNIENDELFWSEMIGPILGGPTSEVNTSYDNFINLVHPDDRIKVETAISDCINGKEYRVEHRVVWEDGTIRWVQEAGDVFRDKSGKPIRMLGTARDITANKQNAEARIALEMQLQQAQKMEALGQLTGGIAHDFNNLLGINIGFTELLALKIKPLNDSKLDAYIEQVLSSAKRASELVSQMLAFSRINEAESITLDLQPVVKDTIKMLGSMISASIRINFEAASELPMVIANPVQLNQLIINICINARDEIGEKGEISISLLHHDKIEGHCSSCHSEFSGEYVELSIRDSAGGMPIEILKNIFNPFFSTKEVGEGTGMGLAMVHGILHGHGAHIIVETEVGKGSNFRLLFRTSREHAYSEHNEEFKMVYAQDSKRVLVVDDEKSIVDLLNEVLTQSGYEVIGYTDSKKALSEIENNIQQYDCLITDQTMPDVTGADLARAAISRDEKFPVFILTGYSEYLDEVKVSEIGVYKLMQKPIQISELLSELGQLA